MERKSKSYVAYIVAGLITIGFLLIIYAFNGIYPFGSGSVVCDDMVQQTISNYTYFWDYLRSDGKLSLLFNWETAAGAQILTTGFYILKPWEIVFSLIVPRDGIVNGISYLLIFKITCATLAMLFFLRKKFSIPPYWQVFLSLTYSLSSFILIYYTNMGWIDAAFMFPFIVLAFLHMCDTGKWVPYVLILTYTLMLSVYIAYMVFMFLLLIGGLYMIFIQPAETRKTAIFRFGLASFLSMGLSGIITVPTVFYMFRSTRNSIDTVKSGSDNSLLNIIEASNTYPEIKYALMFIGTAVLWAVMLMLLVNFKADKKKVLFFSLSTAILSLPALFENINLIWHVGTYVSFPLRYLYMLSFILICAAAFTIQSGNLLSMNNKAQNIVAIIISAVTGVAGIVLMYLKAYTEESTAQGLSYKYLFEKNSEWVIAVSFVLLLLAYFFALTLTNKKASCIIASVFMLGETALCGNTSIGINSDRDGVLPMYSLDFVDRATEMGKELTLENDNLTRIKDKDTYLNSNYPMFFKYPALSNFTHLVSADMTDAMKALGYSQVYTRVIDTSGTILSDMLLNIKYVFSSEDLDEDEYTYISDLGDSKLYSYNYTLPVGLTVSEEFKSIDILEINDPFTSTNKLYTALGGEGTLINTTEKKYDASDEVFIFTKHIEGKQHIYLDIDTAKGEKIKNGSLQITVNGKVLNLSYFGSNLNYMYPNNFNNGILDLGVYENEDIEITVGAWKDIGNSITLTLGEADYSKLSAVCEKYENNHAEITTGAKSLTATVTAQSDNEYLFLPINDDPGWKCTVNGEETDIDYALGSFITIKLNKGENTVELNFLPWGMEIGAVVSGISLIGFVILIIIKKKKHLDNEKNDTFLRIFEKTYIAGMCGIYFILYIVMMICSILFNYIIK